MKTMSHTQKRLLTFAAGPGGRWARALMGITLGVVGIIAGGWWLLLILPGLLMIGTGAMNYCPAGLMMTGSGKSENILASIAKVDALGSQVHKH